MKILLLSLLLVTTTLFANVGKISALSGDVNILRDSKTIEAAVGVAIEEKDKISTSANARVQLLFNDKTIISLGKNSTFDIEEYFYDSNKPEQTKASFKVAKGIFKTITGQIGKVNPNQFKLTTKSASIGIRGTIFFGEVPPVPTPAQPERFSCTDGIIEVGTPQGLQRVGANQFTTVLPNQPPAPPQNIPPAQREGLEQDSGADANEQESGQDENAFYEDAFGDEEATPTEPNDGVAVDDSEDLAQETVDDVLDSNKIDENELIVHNITITDLMIDTASAIPFSYNLNSNDTVTSALGSGTTMNVTSNNNGFEWGFWSSTDVYESQYTVEKAWIFGENIVSDLSGLTSADNASYSGHILGYDSYDSSLIDPSLYTIELSFDFGEGTTLVQIGGGQGAEFTGDYSSSGSIYTIQDGTNTLKGSFYDKMNKTAGTITTDSITGVYNAIKP